MKQKYPFTGKTRYKKKSYEVEYNLVKESLAKSNLNVIAQNKAIQSQERIIAELQTKNRDQMETIKYLQSVINGDKKQIKIIPFEKTKIDDFFDRLIQEKSRTK